MLITNLSCDKYKNYCVDSRFVEECVSFDSCALMLHHLGMIIEMMKHDRKNNQVMPFFENNVTHDIIFDIIKEVPIFLVTSQQCLKSFSVGNFGHVEDVLVPKDIFKDPLGGRDMSIIDDHTTDDAIDIYGGELRNRELTHDSMIDCWGLYTRTYPKGREYGIEESHPRVFIWVDKIMNHVNNDIHLFRLLTTQVILHELSHAMMDINLVGCTHYHRAQKFPSTFYALKEESLATAISLSLIKPHISENDWNYLVNVVNNQPFQYRLGLDYLDKTGRIIERSVEEWVHLKDAPRYANSVVDCWIKYIQGPRPLDCYELEQLDKGMWDPEELCRYQSKYYDNLDVCVQVIKDYAAEQGGSVTRQQMHDAFPDSINDNYEAIIDYPEISEFHHKDILDNTTQRVNNDNIIDCSDGKIAICDYWHQDTMSKFIQNAAKFGITIDSFQ